MQKFTLYLYFSLTLLCLSPSFAQVTVPTSGGDASGSGGAVAYSVGQVAYTTNTSTNGSVAQGVQHAYEIFTLGTIETVLNISLTAFPNPTTENLTLQISDFNNEKLSYHLFDMQGMFAQSPEKMSYQAVVRDGSDALVTSAAVGMQISILQGTANGNAVYVETQTPTANANGLVSLEIGTGTTSDDFASIDWANGPYFIKTETDPSGGTNYSITGTSQLMSVPYALYAKSAASVNETDPSVAANFDLTNPDDGDVLQYSATSGKWIKQSISGDVTIDNTGTSVLGDGIVITSKLADASITTAKILDGEIVNADISSSAEIEQSKIDGLSISLAAKADLDSPTLTGTPLAPSASVGSDDTQIATTEFVTATIEASPVPQIVGWNEGDASTTENSEKTIGNLKFRWNTNDYLEVKKVSNTYIFNATMKHYTNGFGLKTFIGNLISTGGTQYSTSEWRPIYKTWDGNGYNDPPVSLNFYEEIHIEIYQQTSFNDATEYATYSIKTFKNGYSHYSYIITYNILAP